MTLAGKVPVEPLDDERLTNIERRVVAGAVDAAIRGQRLYAPQRWVGRAVAAVAIAAAAVVGWALHGATPPPAQPAAQAGVGEPATAVAAAPAITVRASSTGPMLDLGDARITSAPGAEFAVTRPGGGVLIAMARGKIELQVDKRGARPPLVVRAGDTDVVVVGTRFSVDYGDGRGGVEVEVSEGVVRVARRGQQARLTAGESWRSGEAASTATSAPATGAAGARPSSGAANAAGPAVTALGTVPTGLPDRVARAPGSPAAPASVASAASAATAPATPRSTADAPARPRRPAREDPRIDLRAAIRAQPVEPALITDAPDAAGAVARYYAIAAHRSGDEASQAFYSIAAVQYFRLGRSADALDTLDAYVRRFPGGKEFRAALWLRVRVLCLDRIDDRCRAAAYTYLHEAADAPAARIAELLTQAE